MGWQRFEHRPPTNIMQRPTKWVNITGPKKKSFFLLQGGSCIKILCGYNSKENLQGGSCTKINNLSYD
jgi:hypothetical protein